jgi:hypothetical protein
MSEVLRLFPNRAVIDGKARNLQNRKYCLRCSPFGQHNSKSLVAPVAISARSTDYKRCRFCNRTLALSEFYTCRDGKGVTAYCKTCTNIQTGDRQQRLKQQCVEYKGGRCEICGYNRYIGALEFHHLDPEQKDFSISHTRLTTFEKVKSELDKCRLVCANCHREIHARGRGLL